MVVNGVGVLGQSCDVLLAGGVLALLSPASVTALGHYLEVKSTTLPVCEQLQRLHPTRSIS